MKAISLLPILGVFILSSNFSIGFCQSGQADSLGTLMDEYYLIDTKDQVQMQSLKVEKIVLLAARLDAMGQKQLALFEKAQEEFFIGLCAVDSTRAEALMRHAWYGFNCLQNKLINAGTNFSYKKDAQELKEARNYQGMIVDQSRNPIIVLKNAIKNNQEISDYIKRRTSVLRQIGSFNFKAFDLDQIQNNLFNSKVGNFPIGSLIGFQNHMYPEPKVPEGLGENIEIPMKPDHAELAKALRNLNVSNEDRRGEVIKRTILTGDSCIAFKDSLSRMFRKVRSDSAMFKQDSSDVFNGYKKEGMVKDFEKRDRQCFFGTGFNNLRFATSSFITPNISFGLALSNRINIYTSAIPNIRFSQGQIFFGESVGGRLRSSACMIGLTVETKVNSVFSVIASTELNTIRARKVCDLSGFLIGIRSKYKASRNGLTPYMDFLLRANNFNQSKVEMRFGIVKTIN